MKYYKNYLLLIILNASFFGLSGTAADVTRAEFMALAERVEQLESALEVARNDQVQSIATEVSAAIPMSVSDRNSLIENVVVALQAREEEAYHPWMDAAKWARIENGMTPENVLLVLGRPRLNEPSMHRRIDKVYTYEGKRVASAKKVTGVIRFYKNKVVEVEAPNL